MAKVDISDLRKPAVLAALYNNSRPFGGSILEYETGAMTEEEARAQMGPGRGRHRKLDFDYLKGRRLKVDLSGDSFDSRDYDRELGEGFAARVIENLRMTGNVGRIPPLLVPVPTHVPSEHFTVRDEANAIVAYAF